MQQFYNFSYCTFKALKSAQNVNKISRKIQKRINLILVLPKVVTSIRFCPLRKGKEFSEKYWQFSTVFISSLHDVC